MAISINWDAGATPASGNALSMTFVFGAFEALAQDFSFVAGSASLANYEGTYQGLTYTASVNGTGLSYDLDGNVIAGDIHGIVFSADIGGEVTPVFDVETSFVGHNELAPFVDAGSSALSTAQIDAMLLGDDWDYHGTDGRDILTSSTRTASGTELNLAGNDRIDLAGGNDKFFSGDGGDTMFGGDGRDRLMGGQGRDHLFGDNGRDTLLGARGKDDLHGGRGTDWLNGGGGDDTLSGDGGADTFIFNGARDQGNDQVTDFEDGIDHFEISHATFADISIAPDGVGDTLITFDSGTTILLTGVDSSLITADDFVFV